MLALKHLDEIRRMNTLLAEDMERVVTAINQHAKTVGVDPTGIYPAPAAPSAISVTSVAGGFDIAITDANPQRGVVYYVEFDSAGSFAVNPRTIPLFTTRNVYLPLGTATYFFRCYAQYQGSDPSPFTVYGGAVPIGVAGGAAGTPVLGATQGTGAGPSAGANPFPPVGVGYGRLSTLPNPPRNVTGGRNP